MRYLALIIALLLAAPAHAAQLQSCLSQQDTFTVQIPKSATLQFATFDFTTNIGTVGFKGNTVIRMFFNTSQNAIQMFATVPNPDTYWASFQRQYHESLLAQTSLQACPLLTQAGGYLLTH